MPSGFFDKHPRFYGTGNAGPVAPESIKRRLNARHDVLIESNRDRLVGRTTVDVGSHDGRWSFAALEAGATHASGIEPRQELVDAANGHFQASGVPSSKYSFIVGDALATLTERAIKVDVVLLFGVFYHFSYHVELLRQLRATDAETIIVDTLVSPEGPQGRFANSISFITEPVDDVSNASNEIYPGAGQSIVGFPSRAAMSFLFNAFGYELRETDWAPYVEKWGLDGLQDYKDRSRGTFVATRLDDAAAKRALAETARYQTPAPAAPSLLTRARHRLRGAPGPR